MIFFFDVYYIIVVGSRKFIIIFKKTCGKRATIRNKASKVLGLKTESPIVIPWPSCIITCRQVLRVTSLYYVYRKFYLSRVETLYHRLESSFLLIFIYYILCVQYTHLKLVFFHIYIFLFESMFESPFLCSFSSHIASEWGDNNRFITKCMLTGERK